MEKRRLGRSDLMVSPLCLGGNVFGWTADEATSFKVLDAYVDAGLNFIDTADVYSTWVPGHTGGESETIIGKWMKARGNRDKLVIATKVGSEMAPDRKGLSKNYIRSAVEDSLRRLQTDTIDLYQSHRDDLDTPQQETLQAYEELIRAGKVRAIGASNFTAARLKEALAISADLGLPRYESLQPKYNLSDRAEYEAELEPLCRKEEVGVIPYYGLASGFLTGKYRSEADFGKSVRGGRMAAYLDDRGRRILAALDEVSARKNATPARIALAWLMARPGLTAPIASATSVEQVRDLVQATQVRLGDEDIAELDRASSPA
ncbi:aldo/keto reductase [Microvirga lotononidis]|uniref:Putative oxidoreductase, aryl-alcohol dehydrogenase like protein n=1 Tax=Microvirga lotononidis TaxID=864069 RepID=I4YKR0_9HYPH|nr:aldo/keto reductase [Microvirga lotononidis]EIM24552.1 putative oxidoreductase, aryl-alcohol dehydrogenase like protein [Microvirga lotononidis]WQO26571.1 aldo/keto reductase [Microvirga lotononidis]